MSQFHPLTISNIQRETKSAVTVSFTIPEKLKDVFTFKAGQYITLKTDLNGEEVRRDYSLCISPNTKTLKVAIKEVEDGTFSKYANTQLKEGDVIDVASPKGRFVFEPNSNVSRTIVAFAAGSGITPIMSIAKTVLEQEPLSSFVLVYGNKSTEDTIFFNELLTLKNSYPDRFTLKFVFSQSQEENALFGRIEKSTVNFITKNKFKDITLDTFYICGPEAMIHNVSDTLKENGYTDVQIYYELFTPSVDTNEINNDLLNGQTQVTFLLDDEESTFIMDQKKSVLEAALANDLDAPYSCQGGICSSCVARLTEGQVTMRQNNILTDGELADGLILTCQSHPTTSKIHVDYDDV